jgi:hypothetical protein
MWVRGPKALVASEVGLIVPVVFAFLTKLGRAGWRPRPSIWV